LACPSRHPQFGSVLILGVVRPVRLVGTGVLMTAPARSESLATSASGPWMDRLIMAAPRRRPMPAPQRRQQAERERHPVRLPMDASRSSSVRGSAVTECPGRVLGTTYA
jgi:hypothetical protein